MYRQLKDKTVSWYRLHSLREQQFIAFLAAVLGGTVIFYGLWAPLQQQVAAAVQSYRDKKDLLQWVQINATQIKPSAPAVQAADINDLLQQTAQDQGITLAAVETDKDGKITVKFSQVPFDTLIVWVERLVREHDVSIEAMSVGREVRPGMVNGTLSLKRNG